MTDIDTADPVKDPTVSIHDAALEYVLLDEAIARNKAAAKELQEEKREATDELLSRMADEGVPRISIQHNNKDVTLSPGGRLFAKVEDGHTTQEIREALAVFGLEDIAKLTINAGSLASAIKEIAVMALKGTDDADVDPALLSADEIRGACGELGKMVSVSTRMNITIRRK